MANPSDLTLLPADPPRTSLFAWLDVDGGDRKLDVITVDDGVISTAPIAAKTVAVADIITELADRPEVAEGAAYTSVDAWADVVHFALALVADGRMQPAATPSGFDTWTIGPLSPAEEVHLDRLAEAFPPEAHCAAVDTATGDPTMTSPAALIRSGLDAIADTFIRSASAPSAVSHPAYAHTDPVMVTGLAAWLSDEIEVSEPSTPSAKVSIRMELRDGPMGVFTAVLQLTSPTDPDQTWDAATIWNAPPEQLATLGEDAHAELLVTLRRAAEIWPPLARFLDQARPTELVLDDPEVSQLLAGADRAIRQSGVTVLWPNDLGQMPELGAVASTRDRSSDRPAVFTTDALLDFRWEVSIGGRQLTEEEIGRLAATERPLIHIGGQWVAADQAVVERLREPPNPQVGLGLAAAMAEELQLGDEVVSVRTTGALADLTGRLRAVEHVDEVEEPPGFDGELRPYQRRGVAWLEEMAELGLGGCLADDMGLGKTIQVIALHLRDPGPTLVICPTTVLGNWAREIERFAPSTKVHRYHGTAREFPEIEGDDEIVVTTYGVIRRDYEVLGRIPWKRVIADEAQQAKNPRSRTARALRAIPAETRFALTGTPVENRLTELWAILDWTTPGLLGPIETFRKQIVLPIEQNGDADITARLRDTVGPFLLRRRKSDPDIVPDLPPKTETDRIVPLTPEQATLYESTVRQMTGEIGEREGFERHGLVFKLITALKQICNHPAHFLRQDGPLVDRSGKLNALDELIDQIVGNDESVLVFSQYVEMCRILEKHLANRGVPTLFLSGATSAKARDQMVDQFQNREAPVFLLSLRAGGMGLNLTAATHVIHYDRWWNPAVEDQASDRAWRIGQDRPVQVHRLVTEGTLEDRIAQVIDTKRDLAESIVGSGEQWLSKLSDEDLKNLVSLASTSTEIEAPDDGPDEALDEELAADGEAAAGVSATDAPADNANDGEPAAPPAGSADSDDSGGVV